MRALLLIALLPPVPGDVARGFDYAGDPFAPGHHRGVDLTAAPGAPVRAACSGHVTFAGTAGANGKVVTIRCGRWNVTHLPLEGLTVRAGQHLPARATIGMVAPSQTHDGLHLGVRRATDPLGYVDPAPLLRTTPRPAPPAAPRTRTGRPTQPPRHPEPLPSTPATRPAPLPSTPAARPAPLPSTPAARPAPPPSAPARAPSAQEAPRPGSSPPLAPWPAWAGLALLLSGAAGHRGARARRRRRTPVPQATAAPVP